MSLRCFKQISIERNISKTSQKHLKRDVFFETPLRRLKYISQKMYFFATSLRRLKYISKRCPFLWPLYHVSNTSHKRCFLGDVFKASQTCLKKDVYSLRPLICPKNNLESICDYSKIARKNGFVLIKSMCGW